MRKILVVDDDESIRDFLKLHFEDQNYEVTLAEDGRSAISLAESEMPDLIVLDLNMPVMTGWQAAKKLKKAGAPTTSIPIIALTAQKTFDDQVEAHESGCDVFIEKPIEPERLFKAVDRILK